jgi:hypothetical protein
LKDITCASFLWTKPPNHAIPIKTKVGVSVSALSFGMNQRLVGFEQQTYPRWKGQGCQMGGPMEGQG